MDETRRWAIAIVISLLMSIGGNYMASSMTQVKLTEHMLTVEDKVANLETANEAQEKQIVASMMAISNVEQGWRTVAKAVGDSTTQLNKFTEVLIRLEERVKLKR